MIRTTFAVVPALALASACGIRDVPPECETRTGPTTVMINEVMAANALTELDADGDAPDWIELYNYGDQPVPMCGHGVSNDPAQPNRGYLDDDAVIEPGGHLVVWLSGKSDPGLSNHMPFALAREAGHVVLSDPDGMALDHVEYGAQATDLSAAREPDGSDNWVIEWHASAGAANPDGDGAASSDGGAVAEQIPAAGDLTERIFAYETILEIGLRIAPAQVARLEVHPYRYQPGFLTYDGREYGPVGIRLKGQNSFQPFHEKPSFRINIDEFVSNAKFLGLDDLTLNNMNDDYSMMHERIAYLVARQIGPASRANHAVVTVNGAHYGLYSNVETVKRHLIERWFDDASGSLFEATDVDFVAQHLDDFELESGPDDRSKLAALAEALTIADPDAALAAADEHVNLDGFITFWAMEAVIGQFDALPYSNPGDDYFVYVDPTTEQIWFLPWGMDETFYSGSHDVMQVRSVLATTCLASAGCHQRFVDAVWAVYAMTEELDLLAEREHVAAQIQPLVVADERKRYDDALVSEYQMQLYWFLSGREANLEAQLGPRPSQ